MHTEFVKSKADAEVKKLIDPSLTFSDFDFDGNDFEMTKLFKIEIIIVRVSTKGGTWISRNLPLTSCCRRNELRDRRKKSHKFFFGNSTLEMFRFRCFGVSELRSRARLKVRWKLRWRRSLAPSKFGPSSTFEFFETLTHKKRWRARRRRRNFCAYVRVTPVRAKALTNFASVAATHERVTWWRHVTRLRHRAKTCVRES